MTLATPQRRPARSRFAALALAAGVVISGVMVWSASHAVFTGYTTNPGNSWTTGTVTLTDNDSGADRDSGTATFAVTGLVPTAAGGAVSKCIKVNYTGNVAVDTAVKLYANANADSAPSVLSKLHLKIEAGDVSSNVHTNCTGFTADAVGGTIYDSTVPAGADTGYAKYFVDNHTGWSTGVYNTTGTAWAPSAASSKYFKFTYYLDTSADDTYQGQNATISFRWEARTA